MEGNLFFVAQRIQKSRLTLLLLLGRRRKKLHNEKKTGTTPLIAGRFPRYLLYISLQVKNIAFLKKQTCFCKIYKQDFLKLLGPDHVHCAIDFQAESVLAQDKKLEIPIHFQFFI